MRYLAIIFQLFLYISLSGQTWTNLPSSGNIPARANASMIYHPTENAVYLFGGQTATGFQNDLWKLDLNNNTWSEVAVNGVLPVVRHTHNAVFDANENQMLVFSGQGSGLYNDVWSFDFTSSTWLERSPNGNAVGLPQKRYGCVSVFDPIAERLVTFGGFGNAGTARQDDTWAFDVNADEWTELLPATHPVKRCLHNGTYIPGRELMVIYGGQSGGNQEDIWTFDLATNMWTERLPTTKPPARHFCSVTAIDQDNLYVFGGNGENQNNFTGALNDLWQFSLVDDTWTQILSINTVPPKRVGHTAVFLPNTNELLVFGGNAIDGSYLNDCWVFKDLTTSTNRDLENPIANIQFEMHTANPFIEMVHFSLSLGESAIFNLNLVNLNGSVVHRFGQQNLASGTHSFSADMEQLPAGTYLLQMQSDQGQRVLSKLLKVN